MNNNIAEEIQNAKRNISKHNQKNNNKNRDKNRDKIRDKNKLMQNIDENNSNQSLANSDYQYLELLFLSSLFDEETKEQS
ncbi:MAG: hypothetical protein HQK49_08420 [Oligoflexia bacterium]|nr:hypothetical protein [Oligoflexia bacterium]